MARFEVKSPVAGFTGLVAGVAFGHGKAVLDQERDARALRYFRRKGYEVTAEETGEPAAAGAAEQTGPAKPANDAKKAEWKAFAIAQGMPEEVAEKATRDQLAERFADTEGAGQ